MIPAEKPPSLHRGVCLLSLGSGRYDDATLERIRRWQEGSRTAITFIILDNLENLNIEILGSPRRGIDDFKVVLARILWPHKTTVLQSSDLMRVLACQVIESRLTQLFDGERSFRNTCLTQTYRSIQPKLNRIGVRNQRDPIVKKLAYYVIKEISLLAYARQFHGCRFEVGFHREMLPILWLSQNKRILDLRFPVLISLE